MNESNLSIADYLNQLVTDKNTLITNLQAKGVPVTGNETFTELAPAVAEIPAAKVGLVKFYDYDGSIYCEWTKEEAQTATALPAGPTHGGLVFQEWNWTLSEIKDYITYYPVADKIIIGPSYTTDNGATKLYVDITQDTLECGVELTGQKGANVRIDWGDDSQDTEYVSTGSITRSVHTYNSVGKYVIQIFVSGGYQYSAGTGNGGATKIFCAPRDISGNTQANINRNKAYFGRVYKINYGDNMRWGSDGYLNSLNIEEITIPNTFAPTSNSTRCSVFYPLAMTYLFLPRSITRLSTISNGVKLLSLPGNATELYWSPSANSYLEDFSFPDTITGLPTGWSYFTAIKKLIIPRNLSTANAIQAIPKNVEELYLYNNLNGEYRVSMSGANSLLRVLMYYGANPNTLTTLKGNFAGIDFTRLNTNIDITNFTVIESSVNYIFSGVTMDTIDLSKVTNFKSTSLNYAFQTARCRKIILNENATVANPLSASYMTGNCYWLEELTVPKVMEDSGVGSQTALRYFKMPPAATSSSYCQVATQQYLLKTIDYSAYLVVPTLTKNSIYANTNYYPVLTEIIVPDALYEDWIADTYWSVVASMIVKYSESSIAPQR